MLVRRLLQTRAQFFLRVRLGQLERNRSSHSSPSLKLVRLNLDEVVTWHAIIRALPLALHLDAVLRRWMAEAMVDARQRTFADFRQHPSMNGSFFVRRRVSYCVGVAAGQTVYSAVNRIHGHVELFALDSVRNESTHAHLSVT